MFSDTIVNPTYHRTENRPISTVEMVGVKYRVET
jgi:hypothetical protein